MFVCLFFVVVVVSITKKKLSQHYLIPCHISDASCHVDGQRYEGGETWIDKDDPCSECTCLVSCLGIHA